MNSSNTSTRPERHSITQDQVCFRPRLRLGSQTATVGGSDSRPIHRLLAALIGLGTALFLNIAVAAESTTGVTIFDGHSFRGWQGDTNKTWRIEDGALVGGSLKAPVPRNEFLCTTRSYTNFVLRLKFKLLGGPQANAGVQFRTKRIPNNHEVSGFQADMGDPEWWGCLYDESRRNRVLAKSDSAQVNQVLRRNEWNDYTIRAVGDRIQLFINGTQTVDYTEKEPGIDTAGIIAVQIHGGPASEAWYKDITVEELP